MHEIILHNQPRAIKKQGRNYNQKTRRALYDQNRSQIHHRISRLLKRQNYNDQAEYYKPNIHMNSVIKEDYENEVSKLIKYWGGGNGNQYRGLQFRKLGRMDKIRLKQNQRQAERERQGYNEQESIQMRNKSAFLKRVFSRLDNKHKKWLLSIAFTQIQKQKEPSKYSVIYMPPVIPYW